jgi:hypothetical protein
MKFFKKWFANMCREAWENTSEDRIRGNGAKAVEVSASQSIDSNGIRFTIYKADGGHVVETRTYDKHHDSQTSLYIISQDQNLGDRIAHILTYEAIKR